MKVLKRKKLIILLTIVLILALRHIYNVNTVYYTPDYTFKSIKDEISENIDYDYITKYTGLSPYSIKEMINNGETEKIFLLNKFYFETPDYERDYIAFPITAQEMNVENATPMASLKNGDILITYNTHTFDWRHGHAAIVVNAKSGLMLEHMAIGETSVISPVKKWGAYPAFLILRHPDENIAEKAAKYAFDNLQNVSYSITAGILNKDKSHMKKPDSSHCSHIVWQAYKAVGVDIDANRGALVTPRDIAGCRELKVVQIYGINPKDYSDRFLY